MIETETRTYYESTKQQLVWKFRRITETLKLKFDESTKQQLVWKFRHITETLKLKFAVSVAPGQAEKIIEMLNDSSDEENEDLPGSIIVKAIKMYNKSDEMAKLVILSLLDHSKYSKQFIMKAFNCTRYLVDIARKWHHTNKGLLLPKKQSFVRSRLDLNKSEHFLDFIFTSGLLQDVAYGVTRIKYDSGEEQKVAHAILTTKYSHAIMFYRQSCL